MGMIPLYARIGERALEETRTVLLEGFGSGRGVRLPRVLLRRVRLRLQTGAPPGVPAGHGQEGVGDHQLRMGIAVFISEEDWRGRGGGWCSARSVERADGVCSGAPDGLEGDRAARPGLRGEASATLRGVQGARPEIPLLAGAQDEEEARREAVRPPNSPLQPTAETGGACKSAAWPVTARSMPAAAERER